MLTANVCQMNVGFKLSQWRELVNIFSLERVVKSGAKFNPEKAKWFNAEYLRMMKDEDLAAEFGKDLAARGIEASPEYVAKVCGLMKNRAHFITDFWNLTHYFFQAPTEYDQAVVNKFWKDEIPQLVAKVKDYVMGLEPYTKESLEGGLHSLIVDNGWPMGKVMNSLRLSLVGVNNGPGVADIIWLIGREEFATRIENALNRL